MEQILEKILQKLDSLENGQKQLDEKINGVQDEMRTGYRTLEKKINGVQDEMRTGYRTLEEKMDSNYRTLEEKINGVRAEVDRQTLNIGVIAERHGEIIEHLKAFSDYRTTKGRIADLEVTSKDHTRRLERIENQAV